MKTALLSLAALLAAATGHGQTLASVGLYDTGTLLAGGANPYELASASVSGDYRLYVPSDSVWPINGVWLDNTPSTKWIAVYQRGDDRRTDIPTVEAGTYSIELDFNLGSYDPRTIAFGFAAAADNTLAVRLNGQLLPNFGLVTGDRNYGSLGSYIYAVDGAASGSVLRTGLNTLTFELTNSDDPSGNPAGLYVDFNSFTVVPEPATYALFLGAATLAFAAVRRRHLRAA